MINKRLIAIWMVLVLVLGLLAGCSSNVPQEEEAVTDLIVESEQQEMSGGAPEKGENNAQSSQQGNASSNQGQTNQSSGGTVSDDPDAPVSNTPDSGNISDQKPDANQGSEPNGGEQSEPGNPGSTEPSGPEIDLEAETIPDGVKKENLIKIIAYNIRCTNDGINSENGFKNDIADRAPRFKMLVDELNADILALSEASKPWIEYLQKNIEGSKYKMLYQYRGVNNTEAQPLLFDQTKFDLLDSGYFWLTETPDVESKADKANYLRGATWAKLKVKATGKQFLYYSTHLEGYDETVKLSYQVIRNHASKHGGFTKLPVFVSGDFNTRPWSPGYSEFAQTFNDFNDYLGFDDSCTVHGYYPDRVDPNYIIDYVMGDQKYVVPTHYEVLNRQYLGGCISDHRGIYAECYVK